MSPPRASMEGVRAALFHGGPDAIHLAFAHAACCLARTTMEGLLRGPGAPPSLAELASLVGPIDHLGFIAPETPDHELAAAAAAAGFERRWWTFPSTVLALELGARTGRATLPTRVFKATGSAGTIEVFLPAEASPEVLRGWIATGLGTHFALPLLDAADFGRAAVLLERAGFARPPGLGGDPTSNPCEHLLVTYFDGHIGARAMRLELCHPTPD